MSNIPSSNSPVNPTITVDTVSALLDPSLKQTIANLPAYSAYNSAGYGITADPKNTLYMLWGKIKPTSSDWKVAQKALSEWAAKEIKAKGNVAENEVAARANLAAETFLKVLSDDKDAVQFQGVLIQELVSRAAHNTLNDNQVDLSKHQLQHLTIPRFDKVLFETNKRLQKNKTFNDVTAYDCFFAHLKELKKEIKKLEKKENKSPEEISYYKKLLSLKTTLKSLIKEIEGLKEEIQDKANTIEALKEEFQSKFKALSGMEFQTEAEVVAQVALLSELAGKLDSQILSFEAADKIAPSGPVLNYVKLVRNTINGNHQAEQEEVAPAANNKDIVENQITSMEELLEGSLPIPEGTLIEIEEETRAVPVFFDHPLDINVLKYDRIF